MFNFGFFTKPEEEQENKASSFDSTTRNKSKSTMFPNDSMIASLQIDFDSELPHIEAIASFSPSSSSSISLTSSSSSEGDANNNKSNNNNPKEQSLSTTRNTTSSSTTAPAPPPTPPEEKNTHTTSLAIQTTTEYDYPLDSRNVWANKNNTIDDDDYYISKDDLELLLTPRFLDDYETLAQEEQQTLLEERNYRKQLIQLELEAFLAVDSNNAIEEEEVDLEPETIEALGIAANQVAYLQKYYDVASCKYIYVPSVASKILDGSILQEAAKHYFGKHKDFCQAYAGKLCAMAKNKLGDALSPIDYGLAEDLDLGDDLAIVYTDARLAQLVWGVSPTNRSSSTKGRGAFDRDDTKGASSLKKQPTSSSSTFVKKCLRAATVLILLAMTIVFGFQYVDVQIMGDVAPSRLAERLVEPVASLTREMASAMVEQDATNVEPMAETTQQPPASSTALSILTLFSPFEVEVVSTRQEEKAVEKPKRTIKHEKSNKALQEIKPKSVRSEAKEETTQQHVKPKSVRKSKTFSPSPARSRTGMRHPIVPNLLY